MAQVVEDGLDGSYREIWQRLPESMGATSAFRLKAAGSPDRHGLLVISGECFHFVAGRAAPLPASGQLLAEVLQGLPLEQQRALLACELSFGRWRGAPQAWQIVCSTLPGRAGQALLPPEWSPGMLEQTATAGASIDVAVYAPLDGWTVVSLQ